MSLILVDGSALVYRAYYAFVGRPLTAPSGEATTVAFGFLNSVLRLVEARRPTHLIIALDLPGPTFRHQLYPAYKANRKPMPEELAAQLPRLRELLAAWGVLLLEVQGYEADDVMATVAMRSEGQCAQAWFYSGDKDFLQLLDERTGVLRPGRRGDEVAAVTAADVQAQFGVSPKGLIEVFALSGDASDNIPGAPGIGEKTALQLIQRFGSLEELYARLADPGLTPRLRRILDENREQVMLSRRLFTIDREVPLAVDWEAARTRLPSGPQAQQLLADLGLRQLQRLTERLAADPAGREGPPNRAARERAGSATTVRAEAAGAASGPKDVAGAATAAARSTRGDGLPASAQGMDPEGDAASDLVRRGYRIIINDSELGAFIKGLDKDAPLAVDTETDALRTDLANLVGISLCAGQGQVAYIPVDGGAGAGGGGGRDHAAPTLFPVAGVARSRPAESGSLRWIRALLGPVLADARRLKVGQNLKFDEWILDRHGLPIAGPRFDTMVAAYVLDPGGQGYSLDDLAATHLGVQMIPYSGLFAAGDKVKDIRAVPLPRLALYAAEDAEMTRRLYDVFAPALAGEGLASLFYDVEMPLSEVLFRMERHGILIDVPFLRQLAERFALELGELERRIHTVAGEPFNVQSPRQLAEILFGKLKLKPVKKTATGLSTDVAVLSELADQHPLPALVLEHRQLAKLQNTYVENLPALANPDTGLIHTSFNQAVAATGRLSSSDPNLQNIPVRTEQGRLIRRAFIPRSPDNVFISADYSQVELRLLAHLSGDENLRAAFRSGADVHRRTAALIAKVPEAAVTPDMRRRAKAINFGVIYGMGARALARQIGVTTREASHFIATYFATYPDVRDYIERQRAEARGTGRVQTLLGRRRLLPDIQSNNNRLRSLAERIAVNTPIQGTAADIIKLAMIRLDRELQQRGLKTLLLLQVHDELLLEAPRAEADAAAALARDCMESVLELTVPLTVDLHTGSDWAAAHG